MSKSIDYNAIKKFRNKINASEAAARKFVKATDIAQGEMNDLINLYDEWETGLAVGVGERYQYSGKLYEVIQAHTTQADWEPLTVPALFKEITPATTDEGTEIVPDWKQPTGGHDAYKKGDKVTFEGKVYESLIDSNAYSPTAYPAGWKLRSDLS